MISWLKKHFIPNVGNDHRPHILRRPTAFYIIAGVVCLEIGFLILPSIFNIKIAPDMEAVVLEAVLSDLTNDERKDHNLTTLKINEKLNRAAAMKAADMASRGYFAHTSPEGKTPWYWIAKAGYEHQYAGENLAINFTDSKDVTNAWMNSPTHKENIVKEKYTEMGTGIAIGMYQGRETIFVAQVYANPLVKVTAKSKLVKAEIKPPVEIETSDVATSLVSPEVLGARVDNAQNPNPTVMQKLNASPRHTSNVLLYILFGIISLAIILYAVFKIRHHHFDLIANGLIVLVIIGAVFLTNNYVSHEGMTIAQSIDY